MIDPHEEPKSPYHGLHNVNVNHPDTNIGGPDAEDKGIAAAFREKERQRQIDEEDKQRKLATIVSELIAQAPNTGLDLSTAAPVEFVMTAGPTAGPPRRPADC